MSVIEFKGSCYEIGFQIGTTFSSEILSFVDNRFALAKSELLKDNVDFDKNVYYALSREMIDCVEKYALSEYEELKGISAASNVDIRDILFAIGYSDVYDLMLSCSKKGARSSCDLVSDECTSFIINQSPSSVVYAGQTWDMPPGTTKFSGLIHKIPRGGVDFYCYGPVMGLTYIGLNAAGICIGTTNLSTSDTSAGLLFPILIQGALRQDNILDAIKVFQVLPKASGHYFYLADSTSKTYAVEVSGSDFHSQMIGGIYTHTNHYQNEKFLKTAIDYSPSSHVRNNSIKTLLDNSVDSINEESLLVILANHEDNICRHPNESDFSETSGAVIFSPLLKKMTVVFGNPCNPFEKINVSY